MHVLGLPPAFVLSQDQTLRLKDFDLGQPGRENFQVVTAFLRNFEVLICGQLLAFSFAAKRGMVSETQDRQSISQSAPKCG